MKNSKLLYVPIVSDYEKYFNRTSVYNRDEIAYPNDVIEIHMPNPFDLTFWVEYDDENFEVYPAKYRTIDYLFSTE